MHSYKTIASTTTGEISERGSKFIALAFPVQNKNEIKVCLDMVKTQHPKARHWCYAYRIGPGKDNFRTFDDGEPSGTAGKPILGQIDNFQCTDCLIIVVRYFGGVLLGTPGLIKAYKSAAKEALSRAEIIVMEPQQRFKISGPVQNIQTILSVLKDNKILVSDFRISDISFVVFQTSVNHSRDLFTKIKSKADHMHSSKITDPFQLSNCVIKQIDTEIS